MTQGSGSYTYAYPRPMVVVDAIIFTVRENRIDVLLIKRGHDPFKGMWAVPGGFVDMDEELDVAAARELEEETSLTGVRLEQYHAFGAIGRDPRGRTITVAYMGVVEAATCRPCAGDDAADTAWMPVAELPKLASDHNLVVTTAVEHLREIARARTGDLGLLPPGVPGSGFLRALEALPRA